MKKLEIAILEKQKGGGACGRNMAASILFDAMIGGPVGLIGAVFLHLAFDPACQ